MASDARLRSHFSLNSPMNTPNAGKLTSEPFASAPEVATRLFNAEEEPIWLKVGFCGELDMLSATSTDFPS